MPFESTDYHPAKCILCVGAGKALSISCRASAVRDMSRLRAFSSTWAMLLALGMAMTFCVRITHASMICVGVALCLWAISISVL